MDHIFGEHPIKNESSKKQYNEMIIKYHNDYLASWKKSSDYRHICFSEQQIAKIQVQTKDLKNYSEIKIENLSIGKIHNNKYLKCKIIVEPFKMTAIATVIQDSKGDVSRVSIYSYPETKSKNFKQIFKKDVILTIIDPFFKIANDGLPVIRVDSPDEILIDDDSEPTEWASLKKLADNAFRNGDFEEALNYYSKASKINTSDENNSIIHFNIGMCYVNKKAPNSAKENFQKSLICRSDYTKALFNLAKIHVELFETEQARDIIQKLLKIEKVEGIKQLIDKIVRYERHKKGIFDFSIILLNYINEKPLDLNNFESEKVEIKDSQIGVGVFAKKHIKRGELLCVSKALVTCKKMDKIFEEMKKSSDKNLYLGNLGSPFDLNSMLSNMKRIVIDDPSIAKKLYLLCYPKNAHKSYFERKNEAENMKSIDFSTIADIVENNQFGGKQTNGLFYFPSFFNHNCDPNTRYFCLQEYMFIRAAKDIKENEQIFLYYQPLEENYQTRHTNFIKAWNFDCVCEKCKYELTCKNDIPKFNKLRHNEHGFKKKINQITDIFKDKYRRRTAFGNFSSSVDPADIYLFGKELLQYFKDITNDEVPDIRDYSDLCFLQRIDFSFYDVLIKYEKEIFESYVFPNEELRMAFIDKFFEQ